MSFDTAYYSAFIVLFYNFLAGLGNCVWNKEIDFLIRLYEICIIVLEKSGDAISLIIIIWYYLKLD